MNHRFSSCHLWFARVPEQSPPRPQSPPETHPSPRSYHFPNAGHVFDSGPGFLGWFHNDEDSDRRSSHPYYPFLSKGEWEIAGFFMRSGLSMKLIDEFLSLGLIAGLGLSFHCARTLRGKVELLPSGPPWKSTVVSLPGYATKDPLVLYYRDPMNCIEFTMKNPLFSGKIQYQPRQDFDSYGNRTYGDWITSDGAWDYQSRLPSHATLLGVTLSSDKTRLSAMTGDRVAHPLLITLANIDSSVRSSTSSHAFSLLALFPVPKFVGVKKNIQGVLENRLAHSCLDFITHPLKIASQHGAWVSDYAGNIRYCFTPLVAYISILASLKTLASQFDPSQVHIYTSNAKALFRLNGVNLPFWRDWYLPDGTLPNPHQIFPIEILHHLHKSFWDHDAKWVIRAVGDLELDLRFSLIQPRNGYRHFSSGISSLKQVTGREHRDIQRYLLALIPTDTDERFVLCIRALLDLRYLSQLQQVTQRDLHAISDALKLFHTYKQVIIDLGLRVGKGGPMDHFQIPKLELLQSIASCIQWSGTLPQWSADTTERLHIVFIKMPRENTNGRDYPPQICRNLDRQEKCRYFDLATRLEEAISAGPGTANGVDDPDSVFNPVDDDSDWKNDFPDIAEAFDPPRTITDLFTFAADTQSQHNLPPFPRTFATPTTAFHMNNRAHLSRSTLDQVSVQYDIPDLLQATHDFFSHFFHDQNTRTIAGRRGTAWDIAIPFKEVRVWHSVRVQTYSQISPGVAPPQKLFAIPPGEDWPNGRCDTAIFSQDATAGPLQPPPGLHGFFVGQIRTIFHPLWDLQTKLPLYLTYVERFDIIPQTDLPRGQRLAPDLIWGMYVLRRACRSDGSPMGAVVPLYHLRQPVQLVPKFGEKADPTLTSQTSFDASRDFYLNHYFDKEDYFYFRDSLVI
ncbi:hypothetical protein BJ322DRAFT_1141469 [Thelephora terrestris]|uniref:DUF6830 domain-containing protein n=1 Tax=Thelephora terrestris TaxID=56493 RepID=A0A9P6L649_9AGAM|nr:hypothetical protein BJ322DRAFT_1141469 [Thelephora terrestris]